MRSGRGRFCGRFGWFGRLRWSALICSRQPCNGCIDFHGLRSFGDKKLFDGSFIDRFKFHGGFVGFDLGENVARSDAIAFLHVPFGELALFHGG